MFSTSSANPAVTIWRALKDSFAGIRPTGVPGLVISQLLGAGTPTALFRWLVPDLAHVADRVVVPHHDLEQVTK